MKRIRSLLLFLGLIALLCSFTAWTVYREHRQERLNRDLITAVKRNDTKAVMSLLDQGADANCHDEPYKSVPWWTMLKGRLRGGKPKSSTADTPLLLALQIAIDNHGVVQSSLENLPLVQALLDHKADVNVRSLDHDTPLNMALLSQKRATVHLLLKYGAGMSADSRFEDSPLVSAISLFPHSTDVLADMLQRGADVDDTPHGVTALYEAVLEQNVEAVRLLLSYHADVTIQGSDSRTPSYSRTPLAAAKSEWAKANSKEDASIAQQIIHLLEQAGAKE